MPMAQGENARPSPKDMQNKPVRRYQAPAATIGRGRKRQEENTPKLKTICHRPGIIHCACGAKRTRTTVTKAPAMAEGRNCSTAMRIISSAKPEWMRRDRVCICTAIRPADARAVQIHMLRYVPTWFTGWG